MELLRQLVKEERWEEAEKELLEIKWENDSEIEQYILAAEIMINLKNEAEAYKYITEGLKKDPYNYELYFMLGNYYDRTMNFSKAYLCFEMAAFYSQNTEDELFLTTFYQEYASSVQHGVNPTSIIILSYNSADITKGCIESIRETNPTTAYEIVVIDNASTDGVREWLKLQNDIVLVCNEENVGFARGCNQGVAYAQKENDILFLNNDTIVPPNALFWLRMGLYENQVTGATGAVTNYAANGQQIVKDFKRVEEWLVYANEVNVPMENYYEKKIWLVGFAMLIKRKVIDEVGLFDTRFGKGNYEDNDLGMRILQNGYELHLCKNSFIYHFGSLGFKQGKKEELVNISNTNRYKLMEKWGFDISYYTYPRLDIIQMIDKDVNEEVKVLEIGCGAGATLAKIQGIWSKASVLGIEKNSDVAALGEKYLNIIQGDIETMNLDYLEEKFDYIIMGNVFEQLYNPEAVLKRIKSLLKDDGYLLTSVSNVMHTSVILPLLRGRFDYKEAGILDKTHIRFFTLNNILEIMTKNNIIVEDVYGTHGEEYSIPQDVTLHEKLKEVLGETFTEQSSILQYILKGRNKVK